MINDKQFISNENNWPCWPFLPLKRDHNKEPNCGFIVASGGKSYKLYCGYMFGLDKLPGDTLDEKTKDWQKIEFTSVDHLLSDGWYVD